MTASASMLDYDTTRRPVASTATAAEAAQATLWQGGSTTTGTADQRLSAEAAYIAEIAAVPLLHPATEAMLARRMRDASLTEAQRREARNRLLEANTRWITKETRTICRWYGVPREQYADITQSACELVLRRMVEGYEPARGRFTTYVGVLLLGAVPRIIEEQRQLIRRPARVNERDRAAARLDTDEERAAYWQRFARGQDRGAPPPPRYAVVSLDAPHETRRGAEPVTLAETLVVADEHPLADVAALAEQRDTARRLAALVAETLTGVERRVIALSYSNDKRFASAESAYPANFAAIGREIGVSRERVRQIHNTAVVKLRKAATRSQEWRELAGV